MLQGYCDRRALAAVRVDLQHPVFRSLLGVDMVEDKEPSGFRSMKSASARGLAGHPLATDHQRHRLGEEFQTEEGTIGRPVEPDVKMM